jgi:hypothetical protein
MYYLHKIDRNDIYKGRSLPCISEALPNFLFLFILQVGDSTLNAIIIARLNCFFTARTLANRHVDNGHYYGPVLIVIQRMFKDMYRALFHAFECQMW